MIGNKNMSLTKHQPGFSLVEILVATALFVIIMTAALNIFKTVIDSQRNAIATQNVEESLKYFLEVTGKEIRMAKRNMTGGCYLVTTNSIYTVSANGHELYFKNYHDQCVTYSLFSVNGITYFKISRDSNSGFITPATINVDELKFVLRPETITTQPTVTMELVAHALGKNSAQSEMRIQTTLASRYYKPD